MPSECYREVFGGEMSDACEFGGLDEALTQVILWLWPTVK
jgi:hypothetical protein